MGEITISTAWGWLLAACAAVVTIAKAWDIVKHWGKGDVKSELRKLRADRDADQKKISDLEEANAVTMRALLALVRHSINGNNIEGLKQTQTEIQDYLIQR